MLGAFGGRIDHTLSAIHVLHKVHLKGYFKAEWNDEVILLDDHSKMIYIQPNLQYSVQLSSEIDRRDGNALVPI